MQSKDYCRSVLARKKTKSTSYGKILNVKQSLKLYYSNVSERLFKNFMKKSVKSPSKTNDKLISILESRLDSVLYRSCLVRSFHEARQLINHGFVIVNGDKVTTCGRKLKQGDIIKLNIKFLNKDLFYSIVSSRSIPSYIELDIARYSFVFLWDTNLSNVYYPVKVNYFNISRFYK